MSVPSMPARSPRSTAKPEQGPEFARLEFEVRIAGNGEAGFMMRGRGRLLLVLAGRICGGTAGRPGAPHT